jgi:hypothetical protein
MEYNKEAKPISIKEADEICDGLEEIEDFLYKLTGKYKDVRQMKRTFELRRKLFDIISRISDFTTSLTEEEAALFKRKLEESRGKHARN